MNQNRKNHPFLRRALTAVLTLLMLVNVCFPAMQAHATEENPEDAYEFHTAIDKVVEAANALNPEANAEEFKTAADAVSARIEDLKTKVAAIEAVPNEEKVGITVGNVENFNYSLSNAAQIVADKTAANAAYLAKQAEPTETTAPPAQTNTSNVGDMDLDDEDDVIPPDPSENETPVLSEAAQAYTDRYNALVAEVDALQIDDPEFETKFNDVYSRIATLNNEVSDAATAGTITVEEYGVLGNNLVMLGETLGKKKDENLSYAQNQLAETKTASVTVMQGGSGTVFLADRGATVSDFVAPTNTDGITFSLNSRILTVKASSTTPVGTYTFDFTYKVSTTSGPFWDSQTTTTEYKMTLTVTVTDWVGGSLYYYNAGNYVAYDVAMSNSEGYNDTNRMYVKSVVLSGTAVTQANSNFIDYPEGNDDSRDGYDDATNAAGQTLSVYYPNTNTGGTDVRKTLVITPADGYYVTQVTVACCDPGAVYTCGTWKSGKEFTQTFDISTGGDLTMQLPASAFCHGTNLNQGSRHGVLQYFILIKVAPVPEPLFVEYDAGIMADKGEPFNAANVWTAANASNVYGTGGSNETQYTQFKYAYNVNTEVTNWRHYANTVTPSAKQAAANLGYYFVGWKPVYYVNCDSNYNFTQVYSEPTDLLAENAQVRLITHVRLIAQWAPIPLNVTKQVTGLPDSYSTSVTYEIAVKKNGEPFGTVSIPVTGNKENTVVVKANGAVVPVTPGTYTLEEKEPAKIKITVDGVQTEYTANVTYEPQQLVVTADGNATGSGYDLKVINNYSNAPVVGDLDITKNVVTNIANGTLDAAETFNITVTAAEGIDLTAWTVPEESGITVKDQVITVPVTVAKGNNTATVSLTGLPVGSYTVAETADAKYTATVSDNGVVTVGETKQTATVTNTLKTQKLTVSKTVTGNMGSHNEAFSFTAKLTGGKMAPGTVAATARSVAYTVDEDETTITFSLKHGESVEILGIPYGATVDIDETDTTGKYTVYINDSETKSNDGKISVTIDSDESVSYRNDYDATIETGVTSHSFPFILLLSTAIVFAMILLMDKARYGKKF